MAMHNPVEPELHPVRLDSLRPTQMTVGMREVEKKRHAWRHHDPEKRPEFLGRHMIPAIIGPKGVHWLIDHHHLALALHREGIDYVLVTIVARLDHLSRGQFMNFMDNRNWLHPYDADGKRREWDNLPKRISGLADDPYRSLAGEVRGLGGYAKTGTPYAEFLWADYLRAKISPKLTQRHFERALGKAYKAARSLDAAHLPGFSGPEEYRDKELVYAAS